ncbi:unnamed protein product [Vitrella brassicaformis CCMP3155]|uniref:Intimal thickness related receptor IRP domain-containing protein n=1 Tax=Vitrella brassicaformis (strain CCMP3155) TaxID=1169540 RepID=A0A0G4GA13_VITBC|nr:unnamed protein product [Vitrella brassicaformis CCMP3155]|eukprot:CEM25817.1 unnamed protein product [Vitrella brassicaformis CCMP3155]
MRRFFLFSRLVFVTALLVFLSAAEGRLVILPGPDDSLDRCDTKLAPYSPSVPVEGLRGIVQYFPKLCAFNSTVPEAIDEAKRVWLFDTCSDLHIWSIIQVGNSKADALVFTGSNFTARRVDRRDVKVPVLSISGKVPSEIKQRIAEDNQVEVLIDPHRADWFNCEEFESLELVYAILAPCWLCVSILWSLNTYKRPHVSVNHLHRFMTVAPVIKTGVSMAGFLMFVQCRNTQLQDRATTYFAMCYLWLSTMYVTVFFTVVLLLSKGWMLTREVFSRKESMTVAILVGLVYVVQSANQLNPTLLMPALLLLYGVLAVISIKSCQRNLHHLQLRLQYVRINRLEVFQRSLKLKLLMFRVLKYTLAVFFLTVFVSRCILQTLLGLWATGYVVLAVLDFCVWLVLAVTFRARPPILYWDLIQRQEPSNHVIPMYHAMQDPDNSSGAGTPCRHTPTAQPVATPAISEGEPPVVVVLNPTQSEYERQRGKDDHQPCGTPSSGGGEAASPMSPDPWHPLSHVVLGTPCGRPPAHHAHGGGERESGAWDALSGGGLSPSSVSRPLLEPSERDRDDGQDNGVADHSGHQRRW